MSQITIPGYNYGAVPLSSITLAEFELLQQSVLFGEADIAALRQSAEVLRGQEEAILDVWYGFVGSQPHLLHFFTRKGDGQPDNDYLAAVRQRFSQWIRDTAAANYDQAWLNYQAEIGRRHHRSGKNQTDGVAAVDHISYRYLPALLYPITATLKPFLAKGGHSAEEIEQMQQAWIKAVLLQVILWSEPYVKEGDF